MTMRRFFSFLVATATFGLATVATTDPDLFWHLKTGDYIIANGIPRHDPGFSFTAEGWEWVTHEWLTQMLMATLYNNFGGTVALVVVFAAVITCAHLLLMWASDGKPYLAGLITMIACIASGPLIQARPQMFNILFSAWIVCVVERIRKGQWSTTWIWTFVPLIGLWVNMHAGFVLGFAVLGVYIVGGYLGLRWQPGEELNLDRSQLRTFGLAAAVGAVASVANPNGYRLWLYTYETLTSSAMRDLITEWQSPNFQEPKFWPFAALLVGAFLAMAVGRRVPSPTDVLFVVGTGLAALQSTRNIPIFAVVVVPIMARHLLAALVDTPAHAVLSGQLDEPATSRSMKTVGTMVALTFAFLVGINVFAQADATPQSVAERFPVEATNWIQDQGMTDKPIFHDYTWGGYLIWRDVPAYIDGRADLYGDDFLYEYEHSAKAIGKWREALIEHGVELVMIRPEARLRAVLDEATDWTVAYSDDVAIVFEQHPPR